MDIKISLLAQELSEAQKKKEEENLSLIKSSKSIEINNAIIARTERSIVVLENQAAAIQRKIDDFSAKITDLEVEVERKRSNNTVATEKYLNLAKEVRDLEDKIIEEKKKMRTDNLKFLIEMIQILKEQEVVFQNEIDQ